MSKISITSELRLKRLTHVECLSAAEGLLSGARSSCIVSAVRDFYREVRASLTQQLPQFAWSRMWPTTLLQLALRRYKQQVASKIRVL